MKTLCTAILFIFSILSSIPGANAANPMGGEITWKDLGSGKIKIQIKIYRDCRGIAMGTPSFGLYGGTNGGNGCGADTFNPNKVSITDITPVCLGSSKPCSPSNTGGTGEGIEMHIWERVLDINSAPLNKYWGKSSCCEITIYANSCCRSGAITTGPKGNDFSLTATINVCNLNKCKNKNNSSPTRRRNPVGFLCCNIPYYYNPGLTDSAENDIIRYSLAPAMATIPKTTVSYTSPFTYQNPVTPFCVPGSTITCTPQPKSNPPRGFFLDSMTGDMIYTPVKCDEVAVIVEEATEYRTDTSGNLVWIGKTRRDMQFIVKDDCGYNNPPMFSGYFVQSVVVGNKLCFNMSVTDNPYLPYQTNKDSVSVSWIAPIPGMGVSVKRDTNIHKANLEFCWQPVSNDARKEPYLISVHANDNHCPKPTQVSLGILVYVKNTDTAYISSKTISCNRIAVEAATKNAKSGVTYFWVLKDSATGKFIANSTNKTDTFKNIAPGIYELSLQATHADYGYKPVKKFIHITNPLPLLKINKDSTVCIRQSINFAVLQTNFSGPLTYQWLLIKGNSSQTFSTNNFNYTIDTAIQVFLTLKDSLGCIATDNCKVKTNPLPDVSWKNIKNRCRNDGDLLLDTFIKSPAASLRNKQQMRIWSKQTSYGPNGLADSVDDNHHFYRSSSITGLTDAALLKDSLTLWYRDSNGCVNTATTSIIHIGNPLIMLQSMAICQDAGQLSLDKLVVKPRVKTGIAQVWTAIQLPPAVGYNEAILDKNGQGTDWWLYVGDSAESRFGGTYTLRFHVTDKTYGCKSTDTTSVLVVNEPVLTPTDPVWCQQKTAFDLLDIFTADGKKPTAANSTFLLYAHDGDTSLAALGNTNITNKHFLNGNTTHGRWTFRVQNAETGCPAERLMKLTLNATPVAGFTTNPVDKAPLANPQFFTSNKSTLITGKTIQYKWLYDSSSNLVNTSDFEPIISYPAQVKTYTARLIAISPEGCADTFSRQLSIEDQSGVNHPLKNPLPFLLDNQFICAGYSGIFEGIKIYSLNGRCIFQSQRNDGIALAAGVYVFVVSIRQNGVIQNFTGRKLIPAN